MKRLFPLIVVLLVILSGCVRTVSPQATGDPGGDASKSAPTVLLEQPDRARDAAAAANERAREVQEAIPSAAQ